MRIKVLLNLGTGLPRFMADEVHEVTEDIGRMLVVQQLAIELPPTPEVVESPSLDSPVTDKFQAMRQHPDHLTQKSSSRRKRAEKPSIKEGT